MTPKDLVVEAIAELFDKRDITAVDRYWSTDYIEHSTLAGPGLDGLRHVANNLPKGFRHERV